jgi:riboflavin biosynthesis pyrimidine reductase
MSIDGYLDSADTARLHLSNADDFDRVDAVRAPCDAILVGAATIRADNPRLLVRSAARRAERMFRGLPASPNPDSTVLYSRRVTRGSPATAHAVVHRAGGPVLRLRQPILSPATGRLAPIHDGDANHGS